MQNCLFRWLNLKSWENIWICCEQIPEYLSKVNKTTFASDMFRVFLLSSHKKCNFYSNFYFSRLLLLKILSSGNFFLHWLVELLHHLRTAHGLHTHCKRSMCEPGVKGRLTYSSWNQACAVCKLLHDCQNKNAVHDQTFRWDKYIFFEKCLKNALLHPSN